ncbi:cysteine proteinase [Decorospora gaudefroyi]|uniref:ubiquitinyl hydrolase 1 n=1 Tax=Decorospora gaudefroyi TaxID=184978 RepID=A0A6A5KLB9_9PLEO|nr:cysteine proteinase [Decorospora gaudefroyi]
MEDLESVESVISSNDSLPQADQIQQPRLPLTTFALIPDEEEQVKEPVGGLALYPNVMPTHLNGTTSNSRTVPSQPDVVTPREEISMLPSAWQVTENDTRELFGAVSETARTSPSPRKVNQARDDSIWNSLDSFQNSVVGAMVSETSRSRSRPRPSNGMLRTQGTVGLTNLGNTGWMNTALQCIRSLEELAVYFLQGAYKKDINVDNPLGFGGTMAEVYGEVLVAIYAKQAITPLAPIAFKSGLGRAHQGFAGYREQDAEEFLSFLIDALHEDLNRVKNKPYTEPPMSDDSTVNNAEAIRELGNQFRAIFRSRNDSMVMDLLCGFYMITMACPECGKVDITFTPYTVLTASLPVGPMKNGTTLNECLLETSKMEVLAEDNAWYCPRCKELRRAKKKLDIWTTPDILVVHLRRYGRSYGKNDTFVDFPVEGLDLKTHIGLSEGRDLVYDLFAVINHYETEPRRSGLYTAVAKNFFDQHWYEYNDSNVKARATPGSVITSAAYVLFYRRRSKDPLGPPQLQEIVRTWRTTNPGSSRRPNRIEIRSPRENRSLWGQRQLEGIDNNEF